MTFGKLALVTEAAVSKEDVLDMTNRLPVASPLRNFNLLVSAPELEAALPLRSSTIRLQCSASCFSPTTLNRFDSSVSHHLAGVGAHFLDRYSVQRLTSVLLHLKAQRWFAVPCSPHPC